MEGMTQTLVLEFFGGPWDGLSFGVPHDRGPYYLGEPILWMPAPTQSKKTTRRRLRLVAETLQACPENLQGPYRYVFLDARESRGDRVSRYEFRTA